MAAAAVDSSTRPGDAGLESSAGPPAAVATGGEAYGAGGGPVPADLDGAATAGGEPEVGKESLAELGADLRGQSGRQCLRFGDADLEAHGEVPEHGGHDGAEDGSYGAAEGPDSL